jgi:chromosome segregation and condensation protein ScpB
MKNKLLNDLKDALQLQELKEMAQEETNLWVAELFEWALMKDLKEGEIAARARAMLEKELLPKAIRNLLTNPEDVFPELVETKSQKMESAMQEYREFIGELQKNPTASTVAHYENLSWSSSRGNRVKAELLAQGLLETETAKAGRGRPSAILKITDKARELFGL